MVAESDVGRIGAAALDRFARHGYAHTALADIAVGAGVPEAQLQTQFADVGALVAALTTPLARRLDAHVRRAALADTRDHTEVAAILSEYLDTLVDHRALIEVLLGDRTAAECPPVNRIKAGLTELRDRLAGPLGGPGERIRASAALGAVQQAVADFSDAELVTTRTVIVDTAAAILLDERR